MAMRTGGRSALVGLLLGLGAVHGCQFPIEDLYQYAEGGAETPDQLIELWRAEPFADQACMACAEEKCSSENAACLADEDCLALTRCVAASADPARQMDCRADFVSWLGEDIPGRDLGGPYHQCVFRDRCDRECGSREALDCVNNFSWPTTSEPSVSFKLRLVDALSVQPTEGVTVRVCRPEDFMACQQLGKEKVTDANGVVELELAAPIRSFQGYLELSGGTVYPTLLRLGWPVAREGVMNVTVVDRSSVEASIALGQAALLSNRGLLQLRAYGCTAVGLSGVSFEVEGADENTATWYTFGSETLPSFTATETSQLGVGGIINTPEGRRIVTAKLAKSGETISSLTVPVRADFMTIILMYPNGN